MISAIANSSRIRFKANPRPPSDWLAEALDTHLAIAPRVIDFRPVPSSRERLKSCMGPRGSVVRLVRLADRILVVMAIPDEAETPLGFRRELARYWGTTNLLVVRESWLMREPRLEVISAAVACVDQIPSVTDWLRIERHLIERGGSSCLEACACEVLDHEDPAGTVLALVAAGRLRIDTSRPLSGHSEIAFRTRRRGDRFVMGG